MPKRSENEVQDASVERSHGHVRVRAPKSFRDSYMPRRHTVLLITISGFIAVWPLIGEGAIARIMFAIAMIVLLIAALYAIQVDELLGEREKLLAERRRRNLIGWSLICLATVERALILVWPNYELSLIAHICYLVLFGFLTWEELRAVLRQRVVTAETISMSISAYLLMGITFGLLYVVMYQRHPTAFNFPGSTPPQGDVVFPTLIYFSFTTLSTLGFGDITPVIMQARYAAAAEAITGQFYLAILVARLVGLYMSNPKEPAKA
jgi:hypothetical protein